MTNEQERSEELPPRPLFDAVKLLRRARAFTLCMLASMVVLAGWTHYDMQQWMAEEKSRVQSGAELATQEVTKRLRTIMETNHAIAKELECGRLDPRAVPSRLATSVLEHRDLFGAIVAHDPDVRRNWVYVVRGQDGDIQRKDVDIDRAYKKKHSEQFPYHQREWFAKTQDGGYWQEPHYSGSSGKVWLASYSSRFSSERCPGGHKWGRASGVVNTVVSTREYGDLLSELDVGRMGYAFIVTGGDDYHRIVAHPVQRFAEPSRDAAGRPAKFRNYSYSMAELARRGNRGMGRLRTAIRNGEEVIAYEDPILGPAWAFVHAIEEANWYVVVCRSRDSMLALRRERLRLIALIVVLVASLGGGLVWWFSAGRDPGAGRNRDGELGKAPIWTCSFPDSRFVVLAIGVTLATFLGTLALLSVGQDTRVRDRSMKPVMDRHAKTRLLRKGWQETKVGVSMSSAEFESASSLRLTGRVWRRYPADTERPTTDLPGVRFPDALEAAFEPSYLEQVGGTWVRGWRFEITLQQKFDPTFFPFESKNIELRMLSSEFDDANVLVPDYSAYASGADARRMGLAGAFSISGWHTERAFFGYRWRANASSFGLGSYAPDQQRPELHLNIVLRRRFEGALMSALATLLPVVLIVFATLISTRRPECRGAGAEAKFEGYLGIVSSLLFVVTLSHVQLRDDLDSESTVYMECCYFVVYVTMLWVLVNLYALRQASVSWWLDFRQNFLATVAFWPMIGFGLFACTLWYYT